MKTALTLAIIFLNVTSAQRVVGYYPQWVVDNLQIEEIEFDIVTHVMHSFAWPNVDGSISSYDGMFGSGMSNVVHEQGAKFILSLGGWGNHEGFEVVSADEGLREAFIYNLASILTINDYDGVDLDWEFPESELQRENLNHLVSEMDSIFQVLDPDWMITMAVPVSNWYGQWHDFEFLVDHVDFFNAMTYGTHGNWSSHSGHLSPLYPSPPSDLDGSCHENMIYLADTRGVPRDKIVMGMPFWGIKWESSDINEPFTGSTVDVMYYDIPELIGNGWTYHWDEDALCPYLIKNDSTRIITYEDQQSIGSKCQYVLENELGGVMIWALSYDKTENGQELMQSIEENYITNFSDELISIPDEISLSNYPNPFNPVTTIRYDLSEDVMVNITIYDIAGRQVKALLNSQQTSGYGSIQWNATNDIGQQVAGGVYLYSIEAGEFRQTNKMVLLK